MRSLPFILSSVVLWRSQIPRWSAASAQPRRDYTAHEGASLQPDLVITSAQNPRIKAVRALLKNRTRASEDLILLEGHRLILDAIQAGFCPEQLFYTDEAFGEGNGAGFRWRGATPQVLSRMEKILVTSSVINAISDTVNPQVRANTFLEFHWFDANSIGLIADRGIFDD